MMRVSIIIICTMIIGLILMYSRIVEIGTAHQALRYVRLTGRDLLVFENTTLQLFQNALERDGGYKFTNQPIKANLLFFNLLADYADMYDTVNAISSCTIIYGIVTIDMFASKSNMYQHLRRSLPANALRDVVPKTYLMTDTDLSRFNEEYDPSKWYILKKNIQRQKGVLITRSAERIRSAVKDQYVVCQELITDNFLVEGRKINLRKYVLIIVRKQPRIYMYNNGFIYYAKELFDSTSSRHEVHITTGYIDRKIYESNPLTVQELYERMGKSGETLRANVRRTLRTVFQTYIPLLKEEDSLNLKTNFVILGCDLSVDRTLNVKLMEINKGPDMNTKDSRDGSLKQDLVSNSLRLAGAIPGSPKNFARIF